MRISLVFCCSVALSRGIETTDSEHVREFLASKDFDRLAAKHFINRDDYTHQEWSYFQANFWRHLGEEFHSKQMDAPQLASLLEDAEPIVTKKKTSIFAKSVAAAADDNDDGPSWELSAEQPRFEGWSRRDTKKMMGTFVGDHPKRKDLPEEQTFHMHDKSLYENLPETFDSRDKWSTMCPTIGHIRDQSTCGSCWAFASTEAFNDRYCISHAGNFTKLLSPQHTASCCDAMHCFSFGCSGGNPGLAWSWLTDSGVVSGGDYDDLNHKDTCWPYELPLCSHHVNNTKLPPCKGDSDTPQCRDTCLNKGFKTPFEQDLHKGSSSYNIKSQDHIKFQLFTNGPVTAGFTVYEDFITYKSGIYTGPANDDVKELGGHAVKVVGYGPDYWLIANSWNESWGDKGLFKIKMGVCGIDDQMAAGDILPQSKPRIEEEETIYA